MVRFSFLLAFYFVLSSESKAQIFLYGPSEVTIPVGMSSLVATIGYYPYKTCRPNSHSGNFDSGDVSIFDLRSSTEDQIYCLPKKTGSFAVRATFRVLEWNDDSNYSCGTIQSSMTFKVNVVQQGAEAELHNNTLFHLRLFNTIISLPLSSIFNFYLFDLTGRPIRQIERDVPAGTSEIDLDASSLPAGCYWYTVHGNGWSKSGKVMKLP